MNISIICALTAFILILLGEMNNCQTINIPSDYMTIQEGINAANSGDTVLVDNGEYFENINFRGKNIVVASKFIIDGNYTHITNTIINGSKSTKIDTGSCVIFSSGEDSTAVIQGFALTGGTGTSYYFGIGVPLYREGGAIILDHSSATIKNNIIYKNEAKGNRNAQDGGGGGISSMFGNPRIYNNIIIENKAAYAAGIVLNWSGGIIKNNIICYNYTVGQFGTGGLMVWESQPWSATIENNTIVYNSSSTTAGGLSVENSSAYILNNIIWGNTQQNGKQITGHESSIVEYCNTEESFSGDGNITGNPQIQDGNFILTSSSPCIDMGNPKMILNDPKDTNNVGLALYPSRGGLRNDIGAYGGPGSSIFPDFNVVDVEEDEIIFPESFSLDQNYPNPFNPSTTLSYSIPEHSQVELKVYDVLGREVATLVNKEQSAGNYEVQLDASSLTSGLYIYQLRSGNFVESRKMLLLN